MGRVDYSLAQAPSHYCDVPPIRTWDEGATARGEDVFETVRHLPIGTRYFCECGKVWMVVWIPDQVSPTMVMCAHHEWALESRRERRRREGKRWWQR